jgi:hypothetical protein
MSTKFLGFVGWRLIFHDLATIFSASKFGYSNLYRCTHIISLYLLYVHSTILICIWKTHRDFQLGGRCTLDDVQNIQSKLSPHIEYFILNGCNCYFGSDDLCSHDTKLNCVLSLYSIIKLLDMTLIGHPLSKQFRCDDLFGRFNI